MSKRDAEDDLSVIQGDFFTDGGKFIFRLAGTSLSGVGDTPTAAFDDLMRVEAATAPLSTRMRELARDQQGEKVRAEIVRMSMIGLIVFGVVGGALAASVALAPKVVADVGGAAVSHMMHAVDNMTPQQEASVSHTMQHLNALVKGPDAAAGCAKPAAAAPATTAKP